ncbi:ATP-binding protein (plasmid) [Streptomyces sp. QH1-20]|uniref:ATP-binding protein n=1 Tax=Streptomyces sp. QH1-20 TaxID=3240934 RepID=UPI0035181523
MSEDMNLSPEDLAAFRAWKAQTSATPPAQRGKGKGAAGGAEKMSVADQIIAMADSRYEFGTSDAGDLYAVPKDGPRIARLLRGGRISLRAELARTYYGLHGKAASSSALADAMLAIEGRAQAEDPVPLHLRVAPLGKRPEGGLVLDLGRSDGTVVTITREGWTVAPAAEGQPLFRRSQLTQPLPIPVRGGSLRELRGLLNVTEESWPLMVSWLVSGLVPGIPHPLLFLSGEQGTAKTSATKMLVSLLDPSAAPARSTPKDPDDWATAAVGSWVVGLDNLSRIPEWLSDAMCRAATGDANVKRTLYSDSDVTVQEFRRVLIVNGIDVGTLRGDLADRMIPVHLHRITQRRTETALWEAYHETHPRILGALLDLLVQVLGKLPAIREKADRGEIPLPRMADYGLIMAALDEVYGVPEKSILRDYLQQRTELAEEVVESNQVATQLLQFMKRMPPRQEDNVQCWEGTAGELLDELTSQVGMTNDKWPRTPGALSGRINRVASDLDKLGVDIARTKSGSKRSLTITYIPKPDPAAEPEQPDPVQQTIPA